MLLKILYVMYCHNLEFYYKYFHKLDYFLDVVLISYLYYIINY